MRGIGHLDGYEVFLYSIEEQILTSVVDFTDEEMKILSPLIPGFEYDWLVQNNELFLIVMFTEPSLDEIGSENLPQDFLLIYNVKTQVQNQYISEVADYQGFSFSLSTDGIVLWETGDGWQMGQIKQGELTMLPDLMTALPTGVSPNPQGKVRWDPSGEYMVFVNNSEQPEYVYNYEQQELLHWPELVEGKSVFLGWVNTE